MTNKPMLSVERELLELVTDNRYINKESISIRRWEALCKLRSILSKPAAQHQGEPVAICRLWNEGGSGERTSVEFIGEPCADGTLLYAEQPAPVAVFNPERALLERWAGLRGEISLDQVYEEARSLLEKPAPTAHTMRSVMEITQEASQFYVPGTSNWCGHIANSLNRVKP